MANEERRQAKADASAAKAKSKAMRPWYKKKRIIIPGLLILVIFLVAVGSDENDSTTANNSNGASEQEYRFAERPDKQDVDVEVLVNEPAIIEGVEMTVTDVRYTSSLSEYETAESGEEFAIVTVEIVNNSEEVRAYNPFNFRVQTSGGRVLDAAWTSTDNDLSSGDLVAGGSVDGTIVFELPQEDGDRYLLWAPSYSSQRGVVQLSN